MNYYQYANKRLQPLVQGPIKQFVSQASEMYKEARNHTESKYNTLIGRNAQAYDRHWLANERLYELALNYDEMTPKIHSNGKNSFYTVLKQENVILTISQVSTPGEKVRDSKFRNELASQFGANYSLFEPTPAITLPSMNKPIYAVILHGPISSKEPNLGFMNIAVPDRAFSSYPFNKCLFEMCGLKHPFKLDEPKVEKIPQKPTVTLKKPSTDN